MKIPQIEHLILVAAPRSSGKSSFLNNPGQYLSHELQQEDLAFLKKSPVPHRAVMDKGRIRQRHLTQMIIHVDLTSPIMKYASARDIEELQKFITNNPYPDWKHLNNYRNAAEKISVLTLFIKREVNLNRWIHRCLSSKYDDRTSSNKRYLGKKPRERMPFYKAATMAAILSSDNALPLLHQEIYKSWHKTVESMNPSSHHYLDISGSKYPLMDNEQISAALGR